VSIWSAREARTPASAVDRILRDVEPLSPDLMDGLPVGLLRILRDRRIAEANDAAGTILGRPAAALVGRSVMEAFLDHRLDDLVGTAAAGGSGSLELDLPADRRVIVRVRPAPPSLAWLVLEDVTELRRLQRIRAEFIDNLAHELRTPLTTIRLLTERVADELAGVEVPERVRERIGTIDVETGHLVQMVNELLDLARIEQAATRLDLEDLPALGLLTDAARRLAPFAERQGVRIDLIPADASLVLRGDRDRLGQVIVNLLHNALKFSPAGGTVTLRAEAGAEGGMVALSIRDEGPGIPRADQVRIFERFYKVDRARPRTGGGTGLGLSIARHIVEGHGGRISVSSVEGEGATFRVEIPAANP